jgi:hypothetical protein
MLVKIDFFIKEPFSNPWNVIQGSPDCNLSCPDGEIDERLLFPPLQHANSLLMGEDQGYRTRISTVNSTCAGKLPQHASRACQSSRLFEKLTLARPLAMGLTGSLDPCRRRALVLRNAAK